MGVKDLWQLLEPVGRRVNIETLTNKRLAIGARPRATRAVPLQPLAPAGRCSGHADRARADASIWLHQFLAAMRDQRGEVIHNAHLLGFFRRICR
jgi:DNA excision repair protein ERCC-5